MGNLSKRIADSISAAPDERLSRRPADDRWCVMEQLQHLVDCDEFMRERIVAILTKDEPAIVNRDDYAENAKTFESGARDAHVETLLASLSQSRARLLSEIEAASGEDLMRTGKHEIYGPISVYQILRHLVWHDHRHFEAMKRLLSD